MRKLLILAAALIMVLALAACEGDEPATLMQPDEDPYYSAGSSPGGADYVYDEYDHDYFDFGDDFAWDAPMPTFGYWSGTVTEVSTEYSYPPTHIFHLEGELGSATFIADFNTFFLGEMPQVGDTITGHIQNDMPMTMIYPPQFNVSVIVNGDYVGLYADRFVKVTVDRFGEEFLSYGGDLQLNIGEDTVIMLQNGEPIGAEYLAHRKLVVVYSITTRSLPPITTPEKIVVLFERFATGPAALN